MDTVLMSMACRRGSYSYFLPSVLVVPVNELILSTYCISYIYIYECYILYTYLIFVVLRGFEVTCSKILLVTVYDCQVEKGKVTWN